MTSSLVHRPEGGGGSMTSGGTESILMSMMTNRARAEAKGIDRPQILAPRTAHPAYAKAAHYFGMGVVRVPLDEHYRADVQAAESLIGPNTAVVVASAFSYPYGVMDPVEDLAALASQVADKADRVATGPGEYLAWAPPSGEQLWLQISHSGDAMGMNPHFAGKSAIRVGVEARVTRPSQTPLDGTAT